MPTRADPRQDHQPWPVTSVPHRAARLGTPERGQAPDVSGPGPRRDRLRTVVVLMPPPLRAGDQFFRRPVELIQGQLQPGWIIRPPAEGVGVHPLVHLRIVTPLLPGRLPALRPRRLVEIGATLHDAGPARSAEAYRKLLRAKRRPHRTRPTYPGRAADLRRERWGVTIPASVQRPHAGCAVVADGSCMRDWQRAGRTRA